MNEAVQFIKDCGTFYVATEDGGQPRVRPFGAVLEHGGRAYFCTGNHKNFYKQCVKNPRAEICACAQDGNWLRVEGSVVFENDAQVKKEFFEAYPGVAGIYQSTDNPVFEVFYLKDARATFYSFAAAPRTIAM
jgi:uncharacterized pyridoxamine 5'-phosphate oxidase family protein